MQPNRQINVLVELVKDTVKIGKTLERQWRRIIGPANANQMHQFGDIVRGLNTHVSNAHKLVANAKRMNSPEDEIIALGTLQTCLVQCRLAYAFHDEQLQPFMQLYGKPKDITTLCTTAHELRDQIEHVQLRIRNISNPSTNQALSAMGQHIRNQVLQQHGADALPKKRRRSKTR